MANFLFNEGKNAMMTAGLNLSSDTISIALVKNSPAITPSATMTNISTFSSNILGTAQTLGGKTVTSNVFDASPVTFTAVANGNTVQGFVIYKQSNGLLIAWIDTGSGSSIPFATNGGNITLTFSGGPNKIFAL